MNKIRAVVGMMVLSMVLSVPMTVGAQEIIPAEAEESAFTDRGIGESPALPQWTGTSQADSRLTVSGRTLNASVTVRPKNGTLSTSGTLYIERKDGNRWVQVASTRVSGTGRVSATKTYTGTSGKTYRARYSGTTGSDSVSSTSTEVTVR